MERDVAELVLAQRYAEAATLLERELAACEDPPRAVLLARDLGTLMRDHLGDIDGAMRAYERALAIDEHDRETLAGMAKLCEMTADWARLIQMHQRMAEIANHHAEVASHYVTMARVARDSLNDMKACNDYAQQALDIDPDNAEALRLKRQ